MSSTRRTFLKAAGAAGVMLVAAGGVFVATRRPEAALRAWEAAKTPSPEARLDAFRYAILAPNPHNRQPWQIRLVGTSEAIIYCDLDRRLPQTDPLIVRLLLASAVSWNWRGSRLPSAACGWRRRCSPRANPSHGSPRRRLRIFA